MFGTLDRDGYAIAPAVLDPATVAVLRDAAAGECVGIDGGGSYDGGGVPGDAAVRAKGRQVYAVRNLLARSPAVRRAADLPAVRRLVEPIVGPTARVVRAILFDKMPAANWKVPWHQDLSIAVRGRRDVAGFGPWSVKAGVPHVQPPADVLARMLTLRLHLDDCGPDNGPLLVLPGTHREGALSPAAVAAWRERASPVACHVPAGGAVLMRPLLLHASSAAVAPGHRRVVHLEWSADDLPGGLAWHETGFDWAGTGLDVR